MYLALFLLDTLKIAVIESDELSLVESGRVLADICSDWGDSMYLGFYDWLRVPGSALIAGVNLILHDNRELVLSVIPPRHYVEWISSFIFRISFFAGAIDDELSVDQEFSVSRCLRSESGDVALLFDASGITLEQLQGILALSR